MQGFAWKLTSQNRYWLSSNCETVFEQLNMKEFIWFDLDAGCMATISKLFLKMTKETPLENEPKGEANKFTANKNVAEKK